MLRSQAEALVAMLQAYFPRPELPASTVAAWATELEHHDFGDGQEAIRRVARERSYPVLAETLEFLEEARRERIDRESPSAPRLTPGEFLAEMPAEVRERVHAMQERWAENVTRDHEAEDREWERRKQAVIATGKASPQPSRGPIDPGPEHLCDRCSHPLRRHAGPERASRCLVWSQAKDPHDPRTCLCDGYVPSPAKVQEATA